MISGADFKDVFGWDEDEDVPAIVALYKPLVAVRKAPLDPLEEWTTCSPVELVIPEYALDLVR